MVRLVGVHGCAGRGWRSALPHAEKLVGLRPAAEKDDDVSWLTQPPALTELVGCPVWLGFWHSLVDPRGFLVVEQSAVKFPPCVLSSIALGEPYKLIADTEGSVACWDAASGDVLNCWVKVLAFLSQLGGDSG